MRGLGQGMLVRYYSIPDKDLQRGKTALTQRNHRHSRLSESGADRGTFAKGPLRIQCRWGLAEVHRPCTVGPGRGACHAEVNTADISELQAVKGLGAVL